ncbi:MAG: hypothetical protein AB8F94_19560 [Saprospiraceae bacterium]
MYTQNEIKQMVIPLLKSKGKSYRKFKKILARKAKEIESVATVTSDGLETTNRAKTGDYIVKNQTAAGEEYVMSPQSFKDRYKYKKRSKSGYSEYEPKGRIIALEMNKTLFKKLKLDEEFCFEAAWGAKMVVREKDFLVCPIGGDEIYRIARKEFFETYEQERE